MLPDIPARGMRLSSNTRHRLRYGYRATRLISLAHRGEPVYERSAHDLSKQDSKLQ